MIRLNSTRLWSGGSESFLQILWTASHHSQVLDTDVWPQFCLRKEHNIRRRLHPLILEIEIVFEGNFDALKAGT